MPIRRQPGISKTTLMCGVSAAAVTAAGGFASDAWAQIDEIIVTVQKREQRLQDVPLSAQAFTGGDIQRQGLDNFADYLKRVPSLSMGATAPGATTIVFRGAVAQPTGFDTISSSTIYLDEQPITKDGQNPDPRLVDIERVEILPGPQPTIYGASSQSGTLKIVTNKPDTTEFAAFIDVNGGLVQKGGESYDVSGMVNLPIVDDKLALRVVGFRAEEAGYIDNVFATIDGGKSNAEFVKEDVNRAVYTGARVAAKLQINDRWDTILSASFQDTDLDGLFDVNPDRSVLRDFGIRTSTGDLDQVRFARERRNDEWYQAALTTTGDLGFAELTMASAFFHRRVAYTLDATAYNASFRGLFESYLAYYQAILGPGQAYIPFGMGYDGQFLNLYDFGPRITGTMNLDQRINSFVQEVRMASTEGGRFDWLVGVFFEHQKNKFQFMGRADDQIGGTPGQEAFLAYYYFVPRTDVLFFSDLDRKKNQLAVFGELTWNVTEKLALTGGARWARDDQESRYVQLQPLFLEDDNPDEGSSRESLWATRANLIYRFNDDVLAYFTRSAGFRFGDINLVKRDSIFPRFFDPDKLINYEVGVKSQFWGGRAQINVAGYYMKWRDFQLQVTDPSAGFTLGIINLGQAKIHGVEGQVALQPLDGLELSSGFSYNHARSAADVVIEGIPFVSDGDRLPTVPDWKATFSAQYTHELPNLNAETYARFDFTHTGDSLNGIPGTFQLFADGAVRLDTHEESQIGDVKVGYVAESWELSLGVYNVWDERAELYKSPRFPDGRVVIGSPREVWLGFNKRF